MQRFQEHGLKIDATSIMRRVISVAAERHPRNYYAWLHARYLTNALSETAATAAASVSREGDKDKDTDTDVDDDLAGMLEVAKNWALRHHDDISGWAFLMFFLDRHPEYAGQVLSETARLAASFHWRNESVWYFLRNMAARAWCDWDWREGVEATRLALLDGAERGSDGERILEQAASWIQTYTA
jgi:protein prenyltransferase alpha subunit repeat containing protein 1